MSQEDYQYAWIAYLIGSAIILLGWWFVTQGIGNRYVRNGLRIFAAVLLLTPHATQSGEMLMSPALFVAVLDPLFTEDGDFFRAGTPLLTTLGVCLVLYILIDLLFLRRRREKQAQAALEADRAELLAESHQHS